MKFRAHELDLPAFDLQVTASEVLRRFTMFCEEKLTEALIARFGELPPVEEIKRHCRCFVTPEGVRHFAWTESPPRIGDQTNPSEVLVSIKPPFP